MDFADADQKYSKQPMPYSKSLAARIHQALSQRKGIVEKKMFGGIGFLLHGNMLVGVWNDSLIVRLGPEQGEEALSEPHVKVFDVTGRPMKGCVMVEPEGVENDEQLAEWIRRASEFVITLPAKWTNTRKETAMNDAFERRVNAAAVAGWWVVLIAAGLLLLSWVAYLIVIPAEPAWFLSLLGPQLDWAFVQKIWFWALVVFKLSVWLMALAALWLTLWARQLRKADSRT